MLLHDIARQRDGEDDFDEAIRRIIRCGGAKWIRNFCKRWGLSTIKGKPVEIERAIKMQPEISVHWFRLVLHGHFLRHLHYEIAHGRVVPGWILKVGEHVTRENGLGNEMGPDCLRVTADDVFWNIPLDCPLEWCPPHLRANCDEKPINPHNPVPTSLGSARMLVQKIAYGREKFWTIHLYVKADGTMLAPLLILHGTTVDGRIWEGCGDLIDKLGLICTATPSGSVYYNYVNCCFLIDVANAHNIY